MGKGTSLSDPATGEILEDTSGNIVLASGTTVPAAAASGYAVGCIFEKNNGAAGSAIYVNEGTNTSCQFNSMTSAGGGGAAVAAGATLAMTSSQAGKTVLLNTLAGSVVTLPASTGSGAVYRFIVSVLATSNSHIVKVANSSDTMQGIIFSMDDTAANAVAFAAVAGTDDTITLNRSTTGSVTVGEQLEIRDLALNVFQVTGGISNTGSPATPFSATV